MKIAKSYPTFFNYLNDEFEDLKIFRCFQLQMPVKEITFSTKDRKYYSFGEVESFILEAIDKLGKLTVDELNFIFHLGEKCMATINGTIGAIETVEDLLKEDKKPEKKK